MPRASAAAHAVRRGAAGRPGRARKPVIVMKVGHSILGGRVRPVPHRRHRRRRRGDVRRAGRVRRAAGPLYRGDAGLCPARHKPDLPGAQHARYGHRQRRGRRAGERRGGGAGPAHAADAGRVAGQAAGVAAVRRPRTTRWTARRRRSTTSAWSAGSRGEMVEAGGYASILAFFSQTAGAASIARQAAGGTGGGEGPATRTGYTCCPYLRHPPWWTATRPTAGPSSRTPTRAVNAIAAMGPAGGRVRRRARCRRRPKSARWHYLPPRPTRPGPSACLATAGIASAPERACADADAAVVAAEAIGYPVVLKILSPDIVHKSEIGGVLLGVADAQAVRAGFATLIHRAAPPRARSPAGGRARRQAADGGAWECILGLQADPVFGPGGHGRAGRHLRRSVAGHRTPPLPVRRRMWPRR